MPSILNISAYLFTPLPDAAALRETLHGRALDMQLKGTVLLAQEGINMFLAGQAEQVRSFLAQLQSDARFAPLAPKESWSEEQPFKKMLVKVKNEIIRMNHPAIQPAAGRAPAVSAATLRRWLEAGVDDAGRPVVTLDTRNDFEVDAGAFQGALDWRLTKFSEFPEAAKAHLDALNDKTIVSYCTGGIRCEKAAIYLRELGVEDVYQLDGGILKYCEEVGSDHFKGDCFVFDARRGVHPDLSALKDEV